MAIDKATILAGQFRKSDADDPYIFAASWAAVMEEFPPIVLDYVCHPAKGLAIQQTFLPSVFEVREACISHFNLLLARWHNEQIPESRRLAHKSQFQIAEPREKRPTMEELRAKHGPNWGLRGDDPVRPRNDSYVPPSLGDIINHYTVNKRLGIPLHRPMKEEGNGQVHEEGLMENAGTPGGGGDFAARGGEAAEGSGEAAAERARSVGIEAEIGEEGPPDREEGDPGPA